MAQYEYLSFLAKLMYLTLLIPGLSWLYDDNLTPYLQKIDLSGLNKILQYAQQDTSPAKSILLSDFFQQNLPTYNVLLYYRTKKLVPKEENQLLVSPVNLTTHMAHMSFNDSSMLEISQTEAQQLCDDLNIFLKEESWTFYAATPQQWVLTSTQAINAEFIPPYDLEPNHIKELGISDENSSKIQKILTEIQTFLFSHPINQKRKQQNQLEINSLFFSKGLKTSTLNEDTLAQTQLFVPYPSWTDQFNSLATPEKFSDWRQQTEQTRYLHHNILIDTLLMPSRYQDYWGYLDALTELETNYFIPAWHAIKTGKIKRLRIACHGEFGGQISVTHQATYAFWRTKKTFNGYLIQ